MNNFNMVFHIVKQEIEKAESGGITLSTEQIARVANIRVDQVMFYLNCLEHLGYIKVIGDKTIELTLKGAAEEKIFA